MGKDLMFYGLFDDTLGAIANIIREKDQAADGSPRDPVVWIKEEVPKVVNNFFPVFEGLVPSKGFVNGANLPTAADFCILVMFKAQTPFRGVYNYAFGKGNDADAYFADKFKNLTKLVAKVADVP